MSSDGGSSRRDFLAALSTGTLLAMSSGDVAAAQSGGSGLSEPYKVSERLWIGPASAKQDIPNEKANVLDAVDEQVRYYYDGSDWQVEGIGSQAQPVPSIHTERIGNGDGEIYVADPADNTDGIQRKINSMSSGDTLVTPPGTYTTSPGSEYPGNSVIIDKPNITWINYGTIRVPDNFTPTNDGHKLIDVGGEADDDGNDEHPGFSSNTHIDGFTFVNHGTLDGNYQNQGNINADDDGHNLEISGGDADIWIGQSINATGDGIELTSHADPSKAVGISVNGGVIRDCWEQCAHYHGCKDVTFNGVTMDGEVNNGVVHFDTGDSDTENITLNGCTIANGDNVGARVYATGSGNNVRDVTFSACEIFGNTSSGVEIRGSAENVVFDDACQIHDNGAAGMNVKGGTNITINAEVYDNNTVGVWLTNTGDIIDCEIGGHIHDNNQGSVSADGIRIDEDGNTLRGVIVEGARVVSRGSPKHQKAINCRSLSAGTVEDVIIRRCYVRGNQSGNIIDASGVATAVENNDGWATEAKRQATAADGDTVATSLDATPSIDDVHVWTNSTNRAYVTGVSGTDVTIALEDPSGSAVTSSEVINVKSEVR